MCSFVVPMFIVLNPGLSSVQILHIDAVLAPQFRKLGGQELDHERVNVFRRLRRNEANAELARHLGWDDRLATRAVKCAFDTVERERRRSHTSHQCGRLVFRNRNLGTSGNLHILKAVVNVPVELPATRDKQKKAVIGGRISECVKKKEVGETCLSSSSGGGTISSIPGMSMLPCGSTSLLMRMMRSVMGSCTMRPKAPEWRSLAGPETVTL
jgi:hypothetical protein